VLADPARRVVDTNVWVSALLVTRDDDIKRDQTLLDQMSARGVTVVSVAAFLRLFET